MTKKKKKIMGLAKLNILKNETNDKINDER
jgi:hypothetical protein